MKEIPKSGLVLIVPEIDPADLVCTCGASKDGFVSFWFHKRECKRYQTIMRGFVGTCFEDKLTNAPPNRD